MAPVGEKTRSAINSDEVYGEEEEQSLWSSILNEVKSSSTVKLPLGKSVLILGDIECGKTTLVAKLQGTEDPKKGSGLEYHYINVKDDYIDDQARLGVWTLDGDPQHTGLLRYPLTEDSFQHTLVVITVSMTTPWSIMDSLKTWITILADHIDRLRIPFDELQAYKQSLIRQFQEYTEPEELSVASPPRREPNPLHPTHVPQSEDDNTLLPLGENTLTNNIGLPIVVVVTKSDAISTLEKENDYRDEHFDFVQQHIRQFCLNYGAALFYTSVKEDKNCELLSKYLVHRIYGFPFNVPAFVVDRDAVFIPSGWDSDSKIAILHESMNNIQPADPYEDVVLKPHVRKQMQRDAEMTTDDEQSFLTRQQSQLSKAPAPQGAKDSPVRPSSSPKVTSSSPRQSMSPGMTTTPKKVDGKTGGSETVLASFFNSLLNKKTGAASPVKGDKAAVTRDAAAELDRMTRAKKPSQNSKSGAS